MLLAPCTTFMMHFDRALTAALALFYGARTGQVTPSRAVMKRPFSPSAPKSRQGDSVLMYYAYS
jgi:hypothetical protein